MITPSDSVNTPSLTQNDIDKLGIRAVIERYAYALDRRDIEMMRGCFTSDADLSYLGGLRHYVGGAAFAADLHANLAPFGITNHAVSSLRITVDGDLAQADMHLFATMPLKQEPKVLIRGVRVRDEYRRTSTGWLVSKRRHEPFLQYEVATSPVAFPGITE